MLMLIPSSQTLHSKDFIIQGDIIVHYKHPFIESVLNRIEIFFPHINSKILNICDFFKEHFSCMDLLLLMYAEFYLLCSLFEYQT